MSSATDSLLNRMVAKIFFTLILPIFLLSLKKKNSFCGLILFFDIRVNIVLIVLSVLSLL